MIKWLMSHVLRKATLELAWTGNAEKELHVRITYKEAVLMDRYIDIVKE